MFGLYRTVLALMVVTQHVFGVPSIGGAAVFSFFLLSGFLMTLLMAEDYRGRPLAFAANRFLRIYPPYWAFCIATAAYVLLVPIPDMIGRGQWGWGVPVAWSDILKNALYLIGSGDLRLIPTSWAVTNELLFYALIGLGATVSAPRSLAALTVAVGVFTWLHDSPDFYFSPAAAALPFALGGCLYHLSRLMQRRGLSAQVWAIGFTVSLGSMTTLHYFGPTGIVPHYLWMLASAPLVLVLYFTDAPRWLRKADEHVGSLSYPIYLGHFLPTILLAPTPPFWIAGPAYEWAVVALGILLAMICVVLVDWPIRAIRRAVKEGRRMRRKALVQDNAQEVRVGE